MTKQRLDQAVTTLGLASSRSQAESFIKLGRVKVNGQIITKPGHFVSLETKPKIKLDQKTRYVSRGALKLASVAPVFKLNFKGKIVLDVGSSTGGFSDYALQNGAAKVIAVDVGSGQMHASLKSNRRLELNEQTDIRQFKLSQPPDIVLIDLSFISLRQILPELSKQLGADTLIVAMLKPQFEAGDSVKHKGVIKNDRIRRSILKDFESWLTQLFLILDKADSAVSGTHGNVERFYLLKKLA